MIEHKHFKGTSSESELIKRLDEFVDDYLSLKKRLENAEASVAEISKKKKSSWFGGDDDE